MSEMALRGYRAWDEIGWKVLNLRCCLGKWRAEHEKTCLLRLKMYVLRVKKRLQAVSRYIRVLTYLYEINEN